MAGEQNGFLDILAAVADHERPLETTSPIDAQLAASRNQKPPPTSSTTAPPEQDADDDDDEMSMFAALPPELPPMPIPQHQQSLVDLSHDDDLAAIFAEIPYTMPQQPQSGDSLMISAPPGLQLQVPTNQPFLTDYLAMSPSPLTGLNPPTEPTTTSGSGTVSSFAMSTPFHQSSLSSANPPMNLAFANMPFDLSNIGQVSPAIPPFKQQPQPPLSQQPQSQPQQQPAAKPASFYSPLPGTPAATKTSLSSTSNAQRQTNPVIGPDVFQKLMATVPQSMHGELLQIYNGVMQKKITADEFWTLVRKWPSVKNMQFPMAPATVQPLQSKAGPGSTLGTPQADFKKRQAAAQQIAQAQTMGKSASGTTRGEKKAGKPLTKAAQQKQQKAAAANALQQQYQQLQQQASQGSASNTTSALPSGENTPKVSDVGGASSRATPEINDKINDKVNVTDMMDVTTYTGLNLKEEEDHMANSLIPGPSAQQARGQIGNRAKDQSFLNLAALRKKLGVLCTEASITSFDQDLPAYIALAAEERMRDLLQRMVHAAKHRTGVLHEQFMRNERSKATLFNNKPSALSSLSSNQHNLYHHPSLDLSVVIPGGVHPRRVLAGIEKKERAGEAKLKAERAAALAKEAAAAGGDGAEDGGGGEDGADGNPTGDVEGPGTGRKKRKTATARDKDMPDHIRLNLANAAVANAIGGAGMKSWMIAGGGTGAATPARGALDSTSATPGTFKILPTSRKRKSMLNPDTPLPNSHLSTSTRLPGSSLARRAGTTGAAQEGRKLGSPAAGLAAEARKISLRDALFCLEGEGPVGSGGGAGRVAFRWWPVVS
ncbi:transcription initiation factor TFIID component TAF4 family-domain-containing protein [Fimicolochytrium jonesii]|uniref:transcription initiation factor TFIID component TAF4 family-domain-containing protein n=1 Tax=Fimicolochytrium jonesii TaxID=1396493 RepID=UPI0022FDF865|nr:transcription initiation factor TFIID component TAF4 family-domain-containing protein [Fimicolochytrium jonesii]KAI8816958.1 transcription initiation factor TFIID component TAF4 family-domain-containing protein [Fimicolochytrium jonesii]